MKTEGATIMKFSSKLVYYFSEAFKNFKSAFTMQLAAQISVTMALLIFGIFLSIEKSLNEVAHNLEQKVEIKAFLADGIDQDKIKDLEKKIKATENSDEIRFISKESALEILKKDIGPDSDLLSYLDSNPLPASFEIKLKDPRQMDSVLNVLKDCVWVEEVVYGKEALQKIITFSGGIKLMGFIFVILLGIGSMLTISSTISMTVFNRKDEIEIMRLVGAADWFIRWPFVLEGFIQGLIGSLFAILFLFLGFTYLNSVLTSLPKLFSMPAMNLRMGLKLAAMGSILGTMGALLAVSRYLKPKSRS
jgi:cell division transport system permease protein